MESSQDEKLILKSVQLINEWEKLKEELIQRDKDLAQLLRERNTLGQDQLHDTVVCPQDDKVSAHFKYIFPLVREIHLLELRIKEKQQEYETKKLSCEAAKLGQAVMAASLEEDECVLKQWSRELAEWSKTVGNSTERGAESQKCSITNLTYSAKVEMQMLKEDLGFTVLDQGVHVRVCIRSEMACTNIHILSPTSARIGVNSDTFVPGLEEKLKAVFAEEGSIYDIVSLVSKYIQEDMAPYVIIIPMKKKGKKSKAPGKQSKSSTDVSNSETKVPGKQSKSLTDVSNSETKVPGKSSKSSTDVSNSETKVTGKPSKSSTDVSNNETKVTGKPSKSSTDVSNNETKVPGKQSKSSTDVSNNETKVPGKPSKSSTEVSNNETVSEKKDKTESLQLENRH